MLCDYLQLYTFVPGPLPESKPTPAITSHLTLALSSVAVGRILPSCGSLFEKVSFSAVENAVLLIFLLQNIIKISDPHLTSCNKMDV